MKLRILGSLAFAASLASCTSTPVSIPPQVVDITIFSFNDFHGNLQAVNPVPAMVNESSTDAQGNRVDRKNIPTGGYAYFANAIQQARARTPNSILVAAGDLIGASPISASLLNDEPVFEALNRLDLSASSLGNHEFDAGSKKLRDKINGKCPDNKCAYPTFSGAKFDYLAANVIDKSTGQPWVKPYVIREIAGVKIAFIGALTIDTSHLVSPEGIQELRIEDEATAINRYVPEIQKQGASAIVVLIHEGANYRGAANDPSYRCEGVSGAIIGIMNKLDPAVSMVVSGHTHQGYTCKVDGRLVVQARSYGAYFTETKLRIDTQQHRVLSAEAHNHLVDQTAVKPDAAAEKFVADVEVMTNPIRNRVVSTIDAPITRQPLADSLDSPLGNLVVDGQLRFARTSGAADIAFSNSGSIRNDLPNGQRSAPISITFGDLFAVQPFGNLLMRMTLTGKQITTLLEQQWNGRPTEDPKRLYVSEGFSYRWKASNNPAERVSDVRLNGKPLVETQRYHVIVNSFLGEGGDGFTVLKEGQNREIIGKDIDALEFYVQRLDKNASPSKSIRIMKTATTQ